MFRQTDESNQNLRNIVLRYSRRDKFKSSSLQWIEKQLNESCEFSVPILSFNLSFIDFTHVEHVHVQNGIFSLCQIIIFVLAFLILKLCRTQIMVIVVLLSNLGMFYIFQTLFMIESYFRCHRSSSNTFQFYRLLT